MLVMHCIGQIAKN